MKMKTQHNDIGLDGGGYTFVHLTTDEQKACLFRVQLFEQILAHCPSHQMALQYITHANMGIYT